MWNVSALLGDETKASNASSEAKAILASVFPATHSAGMFSDSSPEFTRFFQIPGIQTFFMLFETLGLQRRLWFWALSQLSAVMSKQWLTVSDLVSS